jgi:hypothetical protein
LSYALSVKWLALAALLALGADEDVVILTVGASQTVKLGYKPTMTICDDTNVVKVEDDGDAVRLTGIREGKTACGFRKAGGIPGRVLQVTVIAPKK